MKIVWSESKNEKLRVTRGVSFEEVLPILLERKYLAVVENPSRPGQMIFVIRIRDFTYIVPFEIDHENIVLKTIFPSRKFHRLYGNKKDQSGT